MSSKPFLSTDYSDVAVKERLNKILAKNGNLTQPLNEIGQYLLASIDLGFENETNPDGIPWKPNSPGIRAYKKSKGYILKVLQATGKMRGSINYAVSGNRLVVGTNVSYAYKHQLGVGVPKREFLGISEVNNKAIIEILDSYLSAVS